MIFHGYVSHNQMVPKYCNGNVCLCYPQTDSIKPCWKTSPRGTQRGTREAIATRACEDCEVSWANRYSTHINIYIHILVCVLYVYIDDAFKWRCNHLFQRMEWNPICTQHSNRTQLFRVWQVHSFAAGAVLRPTKHQHGDWMAPKSGFPSAAGFFSHGYNTMLICWMF